MKESFKTGSVFDMPLSVKPEMTLHSSPFLTFYIRHLLGKKSWNVYNSENVARVRRDEATAKAEEEEEERRMQEVDAERRIQLLRGSEVIPSTNHDDNVELAKSGCEAPRSRKRRRIAGEDDTDRDIRFAREDAVTRLDSGRSDGLFLNRKPSDAPLTDHNGHISLFPEKRSRSHVTKNAEAEAETAKKNKELEDQYTMRFSNAAGYKKGMSDPWYASSAQNHAAEEPEPGKDVWGKDEHRREERREANKCDNDPLARMRRGVRELRRVERERKAWVDDKKEELRQLERGKAEAAEDLRSITRMPKSKTISSSLAWMPHPERQGRNLDHWMMRVTGGTEDGESTIPLIITSSTRALVLIMIDGLV